jgi:pimeloyl-ACP methyl ester carboxylesterase
VNRPEALTLVLLPGLDGTARLFGPLVAALGGRVEIIAVRYPDGTAGYGGHQSYAASCVPTHGDYVVLGESFLRRPREFLRLLRPILQSGVLPTPPSFLAAQLLFGQFATASLRAELAEILASVSSATLAARLAAIADVDVTAQAAGLAMPALYLRASHDSLISRHEGDHFLATVPGAELVDVSGPHALLQAAPRASASAIRAFLDRLQGGR